MWKPVKTNSPNKIDPRISEEGRFSYEQNKDCGNSAIFHIEIQLKDEALHRMVKMYICLRFLCFSLSVCWAS